MILYPSTSLELTVFQLMVNESVPETAETTTLLEGGVNCMLEVDVVVITDGVDSEADDKVVVLEVNEGDVDDEVVGVDAVGEDVDGFGGDLVVVVLVLLSVRQFVHPTEHPFTFSTSQ